MQIEKIADKTTIFSIDIIWINTNQIAFKRYLRYVLLNLYRKSKSVFNSRFMAFNDTTFSLEVKS